MQRLWSFAFALALASQAAAATICVDPVDPACQSTIQGGIDAAVAGDTIEVAAGTYHESVLVDAGKNGLLLVGKAKKSIIDARGFGTAGIAVRSTGVQISGFVVRHSDTQGIWIESTGTGASITSAIVENASGDGILIEAANGAVHGSKIYAAGDECISVSADGVTIDTTTLLICDDGCIRVDGNDAIVRANSISQCEDDPGVEVIGDRALVTDNKIARAEDGVQIECNACTAGEVSGNTISHSQDDEAGIVASADAAGLVIRSNSITDTSDMGIHISGVSITVDSNAIARIGSTSDQGILVEGDSHVVSLNTISDCHGDGIRAAGTGHQLSGNTVSGSVQDGIDIDGDGMTVSGNVANDNGFEGIEISNSRVGNMVSGNSASGNRADYCDLGSGTVNSMNSVATLAPCQLD